MVHPNRRHFLRISQFQKKIHQIAKRHLDENPGINVMRNRTIAEQLSAQSTFGMESIGFRKCGRRNRRARWGRQQQGPQQVLKTTTPSNATNENVICVGAGLRPHGNPRSSPNQTRQT